MEEHDAFYVVRKGNMVAVYPSLSDCQAQVSSSVCDPAVGVYKGFSLRKETEEYLASRGLKNALYTIDAIDVQEDLFGRLVPCCFQDIGRPSSSSMELPKNHVKLGSLAEAQPMFQNHLKLGPYVEARPVSHNHMLCILEFDGASKGNPGKAGAGAVLRAEDGRVVARVRQGLGVVTNNVAEYRALILGLKYALKKGFKRIHVYGDSQLICMQVQGLWQTKNQNMIELCKEVQELKKEFLSFEISHVKRELNTDADGLANLAIDLPFCKVCEELGEGF